MTSSRGLLIVAALYAISSHPHVVGNELLKLTTVEGEPQDLFGGATPALTDRTVNGVALLAGSALIGAPGVDSEIGSDVGAAFLFDSDSAEQLLRLSPDNPAMNQTFGSAVGLSGEMAIVGAANNVEGAGTPGTAYLFDATTGEQLRALGPEPASDLFDGFGWSSTLR